MNHLETPSPSAYSPNTPGVSAPYSPYNPQTPGASLDSQLSDWCTTDISVRIRHHSDNALKGQIGTIRTVTGNVCSVFLPAEDRTLHIESDYLQPISPGENDCFKVIMGDDRESTGIVHTVDGIRALCTINEKTTYRPLKELCLIDPNVNK